PSAASASSKTRRAASDSSNRALPIPTDWEPCPGKRRARLIRESTVNSPRSTVTRTCRLSTADCGLRRSPPNQCGAPNETRAKSGHEYEIPGVDAVGGDELIEGNGDRGGGGVAVTVHVLVHALGRELQARSDGVDDALVGLVRDEDLDVVVAEPLLLEQVRRDVRHRLDGDLERLVPPHLDVRQLLLAGARAVGRAVG